MKVVYFLIIILYIYLFESCSVGSSKIFSIPIEYNLKDSSNYAFGWYFNKFGDREYLGLHKQKDFIYNVLPTIVFFGGNDLIHQPILLKSEEKMIVTKEGDRHFFNKSKNSCFFDLLEKAENKFGFCHFSDFLSTDIEAENFLQNSRKNVDVVKGHKYLYKEQISFIKNFTKKCKIDKKEYNYLKSVLQDYYKLRVISSVLKTDIDSLSYSRKIKKEISRFKKNVFNRLDCKYSTSLHAQKLVYLYNRLLCKNSINTENEFYYQWESSNLNYRHKSKDFLQFILLKKYINKNVSNINFYIDEFRKNCKDLDYRNYIDSIIHLQRHDFKKEELNTELKDTLGNILVFNDIINQNKGSVIYIDFWASWCRPCIEEMKQYPEIDDFFVKNKIKPILISIDKDEIAWISTIRKTEAQFKINYLIDKDTPIATFFKVSPIPRYVLIDKNGKIAQFAAARLSNSNDLAKQILSIVK